MPYQSPINDNHLPGSYTVVEGRNAIHTGMLSYLEGDIFEVEMSKRGLFKVGEAVKIVIYSQDGIFNFETTVIAANQGMLIFLLPPDIRKRFTNKRTDLRVETALKGEICQIIDANGTTDLERPIEVTVRNVSVAGMGFTTLDTGAIRPNITVAINLELGAPFTFRLSVIHKTKDIYGGKFLDLSQETFNSVRSFVLTRQIHSRGEAYHPRDA